MTPESSDLHDGKTQGVSNMDAEYNALRAEMLAWQSRRFVILTTCATIVVGILGLDSTSTATDTIEGALISSLLLFVLGSAELLIWYAGIADAKLAAYLVVFHEAKTSGWETRLNTLSERRRNRLTLNMMIVLIYAGLGLLAIVLPFAVRDATMPAGKYLAIMGLCGAWFLFGLYLLTRPIAREHYINLWRSLQDQ